MKRVAEYLLGGIPLVSEIPLPELPLVQHDDAILHPVNIRVGGVPSHLPDAVELDPYCFATPAQYLLCIPGIARYLVTLYTSLAVLTDDALAVLDKVAVDQFHEYK